MLRGPLSAGLAFVLYGCSTHVTNSVFDDLVNETRTSTTPLINYKSYVAVSGLIPHSGPGTIFHHPDGVSPTHGISLSPKWSYVVDSRFPMKGNAADGEKKIRAIRDKYIEAREAIVKATALRVSAAVASRAAELARTGNDPARCKLAAQILSAAEPADCNDAAVSGFAAIRDKAVAESAKATGAAALKREELMKAVDEKNILIARWDQRTELSALGKVAEWFSLSAARQQDIGGILILGDLRTWSLKVGEDYIDMVREMNPDARKLFQVAGIDLFQVQAKHREYVVELKLEDSVAASLSVTAQQLKQLESLLGPDARVELGVGAAMLTDISNLGSLSGPEHETRRRCFFPPLRAEEDEQNEARLDKGYNVAYLVRGQITSLDAIAGIKTDLSRLLERTPDKDKQRVTDQHTCPDIKKK